MSRGTEGVTAAPIEDRPVVIKQEVVEGVPPTIPQLPDSFCNFCSDDAFLSYCGSCMESGEADGVPLKGMKNPGAAGPVVVVPTPSTLGVPSTDEVLVHNELACSVPVHHQHQTFFENGVEYKKCTRVHKVQPKCKKGNRLAVQKYRKKKKDEFEKLKVDNAELKVRVAELEAELERAREGGGSVATTRSRRFKQDGKAKELASSKSETAEAADAAELRSLREVLQKVRSLVGGEGMESLLGLQKKK